MKIFNLLSSSSMVTGRVLPSLETRGKEASIDTMNTSAPSTFWSLVIGILAIYVDGSLGLMVTSCRLPSKSFPAVADPDWVSILNRKYR